MAIAPELDLRQRCEATARRAYEASLELAAVSGERKQAWLAATSRLLRGRTAELVESNRLDLEAAAGAGIAPAAIDRLRLTPSRLEELARAVETIALLPDPVGEIMEASVRPNGLEVQKVRVPLGVVFFIYESRPNVTIDAAALCVKSGNAVILRGGKEAWNSNRALAQLLDEAAHEAGIPAGAVQTVDTTDRAAVGHFLALSEYISVAIPRGGEGLIRRVAAEAKMPVIKHFDGICHVYVDSSADLEMAERIVINAKCQRMGVCNAAESLLVHRQIAPRFVPQLAQALSSRGIELRADEAFRRLAPVAVAANEQDFRTEFLGPVLACKLVDSLDEAIAHINAHGSKHTDSIVTSDLAAARRFAARVDSSAVIINASTRFNDGGELGLGAEIGISTDKLHARGPCGLKELTTYKYVVYGDGQIRE